MDRDLIVNLENLSNSMELVCNKIPDSRQKSIAITHFETAIMWLATASTNEHQEGNYKDAINKIIDELNK